MRFRHILLVLLIVVASIVLFEAMRLLMLKHDITAYKLYWDKQNAQRVSPGDILYIALGDSAAQGLGASQPAKGYVGLLAQQVAKTAGRPVHIINLSVTGAKIQDVINDQLPRLQQMQLPAGTTIVTIEIGANDLGDFDPTTFSSKMDELFKQLPPQTIVADMPYFGGGRVRSLENGAVKASEIIHTLAKTYKLKVAPLHETTERGDSFWVYSADFFHPNDRGYVNWYKAFLGAMTN